MSTIQSHESISAYNDFKERINKHRDTFVLTSQFLKDNESIRFEDRYASFWLKNIAEKDLYKFRDISNNIENRGESEDTIDSYTIDNEIVDYMGVVMSLYLFEKNDWALSPKDDDISQSSINFKLLVDFEIMRRKGLISIDGVGKITENDAPKMSLTNEGFIIRDGLKMTDQIVDYIEENLNKNNGEK